MAGATLTSSADLVDLLINQHEQIKPWFAETLSYSGPDREGAFVALRRLEEENKAKSVLAELEDLDVDTDAFAKLEKELSPDELELLDRARDAILGKR